MTSRSEKHRRASFAVLLCNIVNSHTFLKKVQTQIICKSMRRRKASTNARRTDRLEHNENCAQPVQGKTSFQTFEIRLLITHLKSLSDMSLRKDTREDLNPYKAGVRPRKSPCCQINCRRVVGYQTARFWNNFSISKFILNEFWTNLLRIGSSSSTTQLHLSKVLHKTLVSSTYIKILQ